MATLDRELVFQIIETSRLLQTYVDHRARLQGTTRAQWAVMGRLRRNEGLTQVDLADQLELQPISLVRLLDRLVEQKLLERRHDDSDRRVNRLYLTPAGRAFVDALNPLGESIRADALRGATEDEKRAALDFLRLTKERIKLAQSAEDSSIKDVQGTARAV